MRATAVRCLFRPMRPGDIPQVMDIERVSFPMMWPQTVYQRELKNKLARYVVAYEPPEGEELAQEPDPGPSQRGLGGLVRRIFGGAPEPESRDKILGLVGMWCMLGDAHIVTIAVRPELRRNGIGELLLVAALQEAQEARQENVTLEYRMSNVAARNMYDKYGFAQIGVRARYYSDNHEDAVLMTTPPLSAPPYRELLEERMRELRARWGDAFPFSGLSWIVEASPSG